MPTVSKMSNGFPPIDYSSQMGHKREKLSLLSLSVTVNRRMHSLFLTIFLRNRQLVQISGNLYNMTNSNRNILQQLTFLNGLKRTAAHGVRSSIFYGRDYKAFVYYMKLNWARPLLGEMLLQVSWTQVTQGRIT